MKWSVQNYNTTHKEYEVHHFKEAYGTLVCRSHGKILHIYYKDLNGEILKHTKCMGNDYFKALGLLCAITEYTQAQEILTDFYKK